MKRFCFLFLLLVTYLVQAQEVNKPKWQGKFEQLDQLLPTPNEYRSASGAPGSKYWQQRADYVIDAELNDENQSITGSETITYSNNSPDELKYLWLQLDQNIYKPENNSSKVATSAMQEDPAEARTIATQLGLHDFDGGFKIKSVTDTNGKELSYFINQTMMRIDLPQPLASGQKISFSIAWSFNISDRVKKVSPNDDRSGMEYFPLDKNYLYIIGQWFPRMCVYDDVNGWQNTQFLGQGEFALPFGNYKVNITVPADHIMAGTGMVQNLQEVLTPEQYARFEKAKTSFDKPVIICTQEEAIQREKSRAKERKTWKFVAENVRDFAFATSRKFIWDAQAVNLSGKSPLAMSYYPKEANPLWERESTKVVKNTLTTYSKYTIDYPYPQASSVHGADLGMEYPMICFNDGRPNEDGSYTEKTKWATVSVITHEIGHNFFPMIINSDERQWTWMDEGLNTFVQYRTQVENYPDMSQKRGPAANIVPYMKSNPDLQRPIMVNSETVLDPNFGNEQYGKPATAINILRETVMGPELFDKAFKEYATRWAFKHPKPADFFRTMEDASAVDLDWFWRGWFYSTDNNDQSIDAVKWFKLKNEEANIESKEKTVKAGALAGKNNDSFDNGPQPLTVIPTDDRFYGDFRSRVNDNAIINKLQNKNIYELTLSNKGGLVMPVIIQWIYKDGSKEVERLPAEIWRINETKITKVFAKDKEVVNILLDPFKETADINTDNNTFPKTSSFNKFDELKRKSK